MLVGGMFFGATCVVAVAGYMFAGWNLLDAIYMVVITVFSVGYGEVQPLEQPRVEAFHDCGHHRRLLVGHLCCKRGCFRWSPKAKSIRRWEVGE